MNLSCVAELPTVDSNLNHRFNVEDYESVIQIRTDCRQFKFIKFSASSFGLNKMLVSRLGINYL